MASLKITARTLTPLFMYGADQEAPQLRASSFRGLVRYWLRAVLGSKHQRTTALYEAESAILGSTEQGSRVSFRVQMNSKRSNVVRNEWVLPQRTSKYLPDSYGKESEFRLTLSTHPLDKSDVFEADSPLVKALYLLLHVGGLGRRARRGSGNLRALKVTGLSLPEGYPPLAVTATSVTEWKDYLHLMGNMISAETVGHRPRFATFAPDTTVIMVGRSTDTYEDALTRLWEISGPYHKKGGIFGDVRPRRASAIHMRVASIDGERFVPQQTIFYAGSGRWNDMQDYIRRSEREGMTIVYGDEHWKDWS